MALSKDSLNQLSDIDLARILMRRLYGIYDLGGISGRLGRSLVLEFCMDLIPRKEYHADGIDTETFIKEALRRPMPHINDSFELFMGLEGISDECLISLSMAKLRKWYSKDPTVEQLGGWYVSIEERSIFEAFARLFPVDDYVEWFKSHVPEPTECELIEEGRRRARMTIAAHTTLIPFQ